jgi:hypothetical protein
MGEIGRYCKARPTAEMKGSDMKKPPVSRRLFAQAKSLHQND